MQTFILCRNENGEVEEPIAQPMGYSQSPSIKALQAQDPMHEAYLHDIGTLCTFGGKRIESGKLSSICFYMALLASFPSPPYGAAIAHSFPRSIQGVAQAHSKRQKVCTGRNAESKGFELAVEKENNSQPFLNTEMSLESGWEQQI